MRLAYQGAISAELFIEMLKILMNGRSSLFLILDSLPAHRAKIVSEYVASLATATLTVPDPTRSEAIEKHVIRDKHLLSDMGASRLFCGRTP
jgi:hypothetical protein